MIPRGAPDIGWRDLLFGLTSCVRSAPIEQAQHEADACWSSAGDTLACLSVRSGFDLALQALALPRGSEVIVSAVTIPDMLRLIEHHGLIARPADVDPATLAVDCAAVARSINRRTRAVLLAHLWGSRMPLDDLASLARRHGLLLIEDCAQVFDARYRGHPGSDISMWSFGPIKTATALGGALLRFRDAELLARVRRLQQAYQVQTRRSFAARIGRIATLKLLATPVAFGLFLALCRASGVDHDQLIYSALRSFGGADLLPRLRKRPSAALLRLLARRVRTADNGAIECRTRRARHALAMLPGVAHPGAAVAEHSYWMLTVCSRDPDGLVQRLWRRGFDATRRGSSLAVVQPAPRAAAMLEQVVYLPVFPRMSTLDIRRMCRAVRDFEIRE